MLSDLTKALIASSNAKLRGDQHGSEEEAITAEQQRQWEALCEHRWINAAYPDLKKSVQKFISEVKEAGCQIEIYDPVIHSTNQVRMFVPVGDDPHRKPFIDFWRDGKSARARASLHRLPVTGGWTGSLELGVADVTDEWVFSCCERLFQEAVRLPRVVG